MTERNLLLEKLKALSGDDLRAIDLTRVEVMALITLVEDDALPLEERGFYRVTIPCIGQPARSVAGPGLLSHDVPVVQSESLAESMARCLGRAFQAGQRNRSAALAELLDPRR